MHGGKLKRELGVGGAVVTGLGSILGTGAFVAIGIASTNWGDQVLFAVPIAAAVATFNGLSSAFLAGKFAVAGGTYEYGYRTLNQWFGFAAGWLFLLAKTASASTAALGVALYLNLDGPLVPIVAVAVVTALVLAGIRRTAWVNLVLVSITIVGILWFAYSGMTNDVGVINLSSQEDSILAAVAFLFVAYTGYGRIATLGEEVKDPARVIPIAVVVTLLVAAVLYMTIAIGGRAAGGPRWGAIITLGFVDSPVVRIAAVTAMIGVLLNLILGLSRVWLAMGRRGDMPRRLAELDKDREPRSAILLTAVLVAAATLAGDIKLAWAFSAMTVLLYYGITNLAALAVDRSRVTSWAGLGSCAFLSFFVPGPVWLTGAGLLVAGLLWKTGVDRMRKVRFQNP